jgi:hypothetical protein
MTFYRLVTGNPCLRYADGVHVMVDQGYQFDLCAEVDQCGCGLRRLGLTDEMRHEQGPPRAGEVLPGPLPGDQPLRPQGSGPSLFLQGRVRVAPDGEDREVAERSIHWTWLHGPPDRPDPSPRSTSDERYRQLEAAHAAHARYGRLAPC